MIWRILVLIIVLVGCKPPELEQATTAKSDFSATSKIDIPKTIGAPYEHEFRLSQLFLSNLTLGTIADQKPKINVNPKTNFTRDDRFYLSKSTTRKGNKVFEFVVCFSGSNTKRVGSTVTLELNKSLLAQYEKSNAASPKGPTSADLLTKIITKDIVIEAKESRCVSCYELPEDISKRENSSKTTITKNALKNEVTIPILNGNYPASARVRCQQQIQTQPNPLTRLQEAKKWKLMMVNGVIPSLSTPSNATLQKPK